MTGERYVPHPDGVHARFHTACIAHAAVCLQRCTTCARHQHPPRWRCAGCGSDALEFEPQTGAAVCRSAVVTHRSTSPGWTAPYTVVVAELAAGPRVIAAWEGEHPPRHGAALQVGVRPVEDRVAFLVATPAPARSGTESP